MKWKITEPFDALKKIDQLESENKKLIRENKMLRYRLLSFDEKRGVENVFKMLNPNADLCFNAEWDEFKAKYIDFKDTLPIDDIFVS